VRALGLALSYAASGLVLLAAAAGAIAAAGCDPAAAAAGFARGAFGSVYGLSEVVVRATPLALAGLGVALGFRAGFFNIGSEGQIYLGAAGATATALLFPGLPPWALAPLCLLAGAAAGGAWAAVPGLLKARFGLSEAINTIMFNYIAINLVGILVRTLLKDPANPLPMSPRLPEASFLPVIVPGTRLHAGFLLALASAAFVAVLIGWTKAGFRMRAVGLAPRAAAACGISVAGNVLLASTLSGALAGLAGASEIAGVHHRLLEGISPGFGYLAIIVALLGRNRPAGVVASALGIAALQVGSTAMQRSAGVPTSIAWIIMGLLVALILARPTLFRSLIGAEGGKR
jgi:general nucleoside transport system permease protein